MNFNFDNSYFSLPESLYKNTAPEAVESPEIVLFNHTLAKDLDIEFSDDENTSNKLASLLSGNQLPFGAEPLAQAYAGHQFGHFTVLGDGRAVLLGEHISKNGERVDIQLKGAGQTPYSRRGDGRAALGPMLREYIISETLHALNIPTTRSLAVATTGEWVFRDHALPGAVLTRVASSHIRVGTFEYAAHLSDFNTLKHLHDYTIKRHFPEILDAENPTKELLKSTIVKQAELISHWMRVGFIHGVMNTDNVALSGESIDFGPCAFMDIYDPNTVFSSIDHQGRYRFSNQLVIGQWNIVRFAETLLPLLHADRSKSIDIAQTILDEGQKIFAREWTKTMRNKLGLEGEHEKDEALIQDFLDWLEKYGLDYTRSFRALAEGAIEQLETGSTNQKKHFRNWTARWKARLAESGQNVDSAQKTMRAVNPSVIPRNHKVEEALKSATEQGDLSHVKKLLDALKNPYDTDSGRNPELQVPPQPNQRVYQTFCGT